MAKDTKDAGLTVEERIAQLEQAEARLREREAEIAKREDSIKNQEDSSAVRPIRPSEAVCIGEGYEFEVSPIKNDSPLPRKAIKCCDEAEAIRWYIVTTQSPENAGKQVDPVKHPLRAICKDARRDERRKHVLMIASLRAKAERGNMLTPSEQEMLDAEDMRRAGY